MTRDEKGPRKPARAAERKPTRRQSKTLEGVVPAAGATAARQRIAKLMARVGLCSRRDAEAWIVDGRVSLNGVVLTSPAQDVGPDDSILVDGVPLPRAEPTRLFLFHKPRGLVTSDHDPEGRQTVTDYLRETWPEGPRVVTVGRLDINTEGLLLLTNDGGLARVLELPATGWVRRYRVRAKGETDQAVLDRLRDGLTIEGVEYAGIEAKLDRVQGANSWLTMGLREGKNREIKRVLEHIGLEVNRLIRLSFGPFQLLDLPEGEVEEVRTRVLRDQLGETLAAEAGVDFQDEPRAEPAFQSETTILPRGARPDRDRSTRDKSGKDTSGKDRSAARDEASSRRSASAKPRDGGRRATGRAAPAERQSSGRDVAEAPAPRRERPVAGTRRHVSTLRAEEADDRRQGPRKRIERTDTKDRKDRTITVERLVTLRSEPRARRGAGRFTAADAPDAGRVRRESSKRESPNKEARGFTQDREARGPKRDAARPEHARGRDHASPSALAKRVRIARSGGDAGEARAERAGRGERPAREHRGERPFERKATGGKERGVEPWADAADARPVRQRDERARGVTESRPSRPASTNRPSQRPGSKADGARDKPRVGLREGGRQRSESRPRDDRKPGKSGGKARAEKPRNIGAERRLGERNAGERDARKAAKSGGKRPTDRPSGDKPRGGNSPRPAGSRRAPKPRD